MSELFIDPVARRRIATTWVVVSLWALHIWATAIIIAVVFDNEASAMLAPMFSTVTFGIGLTLLVLLVDRAVDAAINRFAGPAVPATGVTETVTRTVVPAAPVAAPDTTSTTGDVNIEAKGDVNVSAKN